MGIRQTAIIVLAGASATAVCASQTPGAAGPLNINGSAASGGVALLDAARRVLVTTAANESGKTLTLTGTDRTGAAISEALALPNAGAVSSAQDFAKVTVASISAAAAGAITIGTSAVASTRWIRLDYNRSVFNASTSVDFGAATASVSIEGTADPVDKQAVDAAPGGCGDSTAAGLSTSTFVPPYPMVLVTGITADHTYNITNPVSAIRMTVNSGASTSGLRFTVIQQGL